MRRIKKFKKLKKAAVLFLTASMLMGTVSGCGSDGGTDNQDTKGGTSSNNSVNSGSGTEKVNLKVWVPEEEMDITHKMCDEFNAAYPEYDCTFDIAVVGVDESAANLQTDPELAADVFLMPSGSISQLTDAGLLYPITANSDEVKALYSQNAIDGCTKDDYLYGIPHSPNTFFMFYNKSMYTEDEVKSLDTMMDKNLGKDVYNFSYTIHDSWYLEAFFLGAGCTLFGKDGQDPKDCTWNNENGVAAANYIIDLANNPKYIEDKDSVAGSLMKDGKLGALCSGTWSANALKEALGDDFGACALPTIKLNGKDCQLSNFTDFKCFSVKSNTDYPMAAQLLAEWLGNEENQLVRFKDDEVKAVPTCLSLQDNADVAADAAASALIEQSQYATLQPSISQIANYWTPVATLGESILQGDVTSKNVQKSLDTVVDTILSSLKSE